MNEPLSDLQPITVMLSSRCLDVFPYEGKSKPLSELRVAIKKEIEAIRFAGQPIFEVWIHEDEANGGQSWNECMKKSAHCDVFLALYNGNGGWSGKTGCTERLGDHIGICHAEMDEAFHKAPDKVRLLHVLPFAEAKAKTPDRRFQDYVSKLARNAPQVMDGEQAIQRAKELAVAALLKLARAGVGVSSRGSFYAGEALEWTRLDFHGRREVTKAAVIGLLAGQDKKSSIKGNIVTYSLTGRKIAFVCDCVPAPMSTAAARELVGQPFLNDWKTVHDLPNSVDGPVHVIACQKGISETQALRQLGFPDAVVVSAPFGVYVADRVQCIQIVFIANCRDETSTRHRVQRFLLWLGEQGEDALLVRRAVSRRKISGVIAAEFGNSG